MRSIPLLALLLVSGLAQAGVYKCRDAKGEIFYQDHRCSQGKVATGFNASANSGAVAKSKPGTTPVPVQLKSLSPGFLHR